MMTIHTPIELTVNPSMLQLHDNFTERISGNYKILGARLEPEDMLHFLSGPPEIYLAEGGMTSLVNNQNNVENRTLKMDVINNVLNRILVSDTYHMTYQDEVFITSILKKIGVTDVREFIRQVQNVKEEIKNTTQLTDLYCHRVRHFPSFWNSVRNRQSRKSHQRQRQKQRKVLFSGYSRRV